MERDPPGGFFKREHGRRGFALVVTLSLMILLTILAVGLLTLSSVSLRTATHSKDMQTARANARLAMMIAIGEVQKTLGPDQRVSAPADLKTPTANMPHWVGVYGNAQKANYADAPASVAYDPTLLNWLVSGNEATGFAFSKNAADFGKITGTPGENPFSPADVVSNLATAGTAASNLTIKGRKAALLVGPNSAGPYDATQNQLVAAPVVTTKNAINQPNGGYAYWVGDEGTKARINLQDNYRQQTSTSTANTAKSYSFVTSQRAGIESMRRDLTKTSSIGTDYDPSSANIKNLVSAGQFPLLNSTNLQSVAKARFHDLTAHASGVLADCYAGGLKRNLSAAIRSTATTPPSSDPIFTPVRAADFGLPTWGLLRSWAQQTAPRSSPAAPTAIVPQPYRAGQAGFGPVISMCALGFGFEPLGADKIRLQIYPTVILWNPHAAPIAAANYELGMASRNGGTIKLELKDANGGGWDEWGTFSLGQGNDPKLKVGGNGLGFFRFKIEGSEIPPGESHIYVLKEAPTPVAYDPNGSSALARANSNLLPNGLGTTRYLTGPSFSYVPPLYADHNPNDIPPDSRHAEVRFSCRNPTATLGLSSLAVSTGGDRFESVLTEPGGLSGGFSATTPVYQVLLDVCVRTRLHGDGDINLKAHKLHDPLNYLQINPELGLDGPGFVLRSQMGMEQGHDNSTTVDIMPLAMQAGNRWIATSNPLAPYIRRTKAEQAYVGGNPVQGGVLHNYTGLTNNILLGMSPPATSPSYRSFIGVDQSGHGGQKPAILADVLPSDLPLLSLGQLQHAPFSVYGFTPTYCFGNSKMDLRFKDKRAQTYLPDYVAPPGSFVASPTYSDTLYDLPWHLNRALWDRYFVSSVPDSWTQADIDQGSPLPNARMTYVRRNGKVPVLGELQSASAAALTQAAANLMVAGGFNINSTSVDAWRAVLTGTNQVSPATEFANPTFQASKGLNAMMPRFARDLRTSDAADSTGVLNMWDTTTKYLGNRELVLLGGKGPEDPTQAASRLAGVAGELAEKIVAEVRERGPFLSLADFINRDLDAGDKGLRGALQAAIDKCSTPNEVNPADYLSIYKSPLLPASQKIAEYDTEAYLGGPLSDVVSPTGSLAYRNRYDQTSKVLTQADVLTTIGPSLSARSDTFVIRCYGEALNPAGARTAGAWCEAVIQRTPDYLDPADDASVLPGALTSATNKTFGRSLKIISFRWLSANEI